jgi:hypothetical protein
MTCNFLADRNVIINTPFDTTLSGYGHEDTLFGIELTAGGHTITHIDNPLIHKGLEDATTFLTKTAESITNLTAIKRILATKYHRTLPPTRLTLAHKTLSRYHLLPITAAILTLLKPLILRNLRSPHPSLHLFDAYKLYLLITHTPGASRKPIQARN